MSSEYRHTRSTLKYVECPAAPAAAAAAASAAAPDRFENDEASKLELDTRGNKAVFGIKYAKAIVLNDTSDSF